MRTFLDTNVVVYAFDLADTRRQRLAVEVLESDRDLVISTQVLLEAWWVLTRKLASPLSAEVARDVIEQLGQLPVVSTDRQLVLAAIDTAQTSQITIWDALIIEAARSAGCSRVLSEDLQHGQDFGGVAVENPFAN